MEPRKTYDHSSALTAVFMSLVAGCSTALGASCIYFFKAGPVDPNIMSFSLSLAAGVMLTVSGLELLPRIFSAHEAKSWIGILSALSGALVYFALSQCIPSCSPALLPQYQNGDEESGEYEYRTVHQKQDDDRPQDQKDKSREQDMLPRVRAWRLTMVLMVSLTAHNFPEGLAVAVSAMSNTRLGLVVMIAIMVHNIPEGIAIAVPAYAAHGSKSKAMMLATASGFSEPIGAIVAVTCLQHLSEGYLSYALSFVAGIMCAVAILELIPEAWQQSNHLYSFWNGLFCGILLMATTERLIM